MNTTIDYLKLIVELIIGIIVFCSIFGIAYIAIFSLVTAALLLGIFVMLIGKLIHIMEIPF